MLEVGCAHGPGGAGDPGLTPEETRAHFGAWAVVSSPLVLGLDVRDAALVDSVWDIIANEEALAVNRAWAGAAGRHVPPGDDLQRLAAAIPARSTSRVADA